VGIAVAPERASRNTWRVAGTFCLSHLDATEEASLSGKVALARMLAELHAALEFLPHSLRFANLAPSSEPKRSSRHTGGHHSVQGQRMLAGRLRSEPLSHSDPLSIVDYVPRRDPAAARMFV
jgi:hypothetical protein